MANIFIYYLVNKYFFQLHSKIKNVMTFLFIKLKALKSKVLFFDISTGTVIIILPLVVDYIITIRRDIKKMVARDIIYGL